MNLLPCDDWVTAADVEDDPRLCAIEGSGDPDFDYEPYIERATEAMWVLTGRRFGVCTATVRPIRSNCGCACGVGSCTDNDGIALHSPLVSVDSVTIDGASFTAFYVRDGRTIHRSDHKAWPSSQDLGLPTTETGTFSITYTYGVAPPPTVRKATAELVVQLILLDQESAHCQLPMGTTKATYQGLTVDMNRVLETSNHLVQSALASYPMDAGAPSDLYGWNDWDLVRVSA